MIGYICRRLLGLIPTWLAVGLMAFLIIQLTPGDPAAVILGQEATLTGVETVRQRLGLDKPLVHRLQDWYLGLLQGDLGDSYFLGRPVAVAIVERIPVTFALTLCAMVVATLIGLPLGIIAALRPNTVLDTTVMGVSLIGLSIPEFLMGLGLMYVFAVTLRWLPTGGYVAFTADFRRALLHIAMPAFSLGFIQSALIARMTRSAMLEVLTGDCVRTARAKGLHESRVVWKHALRNAMLPIVTVIGLSFALLLGGAFITEVVFRLPGIGSLVIAAVKRRDYPVVQGVLLVVSSIVLLANLVVDVAYAYLDPRIKYD
ncbi:MAG: Dipeptide transport system permease protein DppB [Candidatus Bipolaricaulis sibiricus]|uniref:Dipeptide transport system permease protein DppB n=1 Tax=Bipolaricaulis sibiricus TaxID=2501609 RepID=A0A410FVM1_BIPS1|nr:MAG: Dipeptide transport system permease protein DppB [Candidatus Bipolaricaulis sibiricus]